jgi:hypothetical protein
MPTENDLVLIHMEDQPMAFARIEAILPDAKPGWYHVKLLLLRLPLQAITWILRDAYIDGAEFTMGGNRMRLEKVECPPEAEEETEGAPPGTGDGEPAGTGVPSARVISISERRKS